MQRPVALILARTDVSIAFVLGINDLEKLNRTRTKPSGAVLQVKFPHAFKHHWLGDTPITDAVLEKKVPTH